MTETIQDHVSSGNTDGNSQQKREYKEFDRKPWSAKMTKVKGLSAMRDGMYGKYQVAYTDVLGQNENGDDVLGFKYINYTEDGSTLKRTTKQFLESNGCEKPEDLIGKDVKTVYKISKNGKERLEFQ